MADYRTTENSLLGTSYFNGVVNPFSDYMLIPVDDNKTVLIQGDISSNGGGVYSYDGDEIILTRITEGYYSSYEVETVQDQTGTISVTNEYYVRGNIDHLSCIDEYQSNPAANFAVISLVWGVLFCVVLKSLLHWRSRRV